ncbi:hypothetical protein FND36_07095 [Lachnospiraceae bacterium KGMB03038]|nr:hypothetical protein FND36_07095 [Lachnospiraceae bacterium KGMB03038]
MYRTTLQQKGHSMDKGYLETAITLARMYGIAETLHPWEYLDNEKFLCKIQNWTADFLETGDTDIVKFFESKIIE